jgi:hypothetical protein
MDTGAHPTQWEKLMQESRVEQRLRIEVKRAGGKALKFRPDHMAGMPDRLVLLPDGRCVWAETKAPGKRLRALQEKRRRELQELGHTVYVIDNIQDIQEFINEVFTA